MVNAAMVGLITALHGTNDGAPTDLSGIVNAINKKADKSYVDTELDKKADTSDVDTKLSEKTDVNNFTQLKEKVDVISARQNILTGSVSGSEITTTDAVASPLLGLRVCGKSTQDGVPTPTAPVPIVSAGDGGTVTVTVSDGANNSQTLQIPNALPGIPVASSGNYTDENGQQWVCDEVDLARGVYVQRVAKIKVTSSLSWQTTGNAVDRYFAWFSGIYTSNVLCTHFSTALGAETVGGAIANRNNLIGFAYAAKGTTTLDDFKQFLDENDVFIWAALATPVETDISADEVAAYKALTTYTPTTIISAGGGAGITAVYQRDVNIVVKALEDAIASMTTH